MSNLPEAKQLLGELIIMGFSGLELSTETQAFLTQARIGGVILFAHNAESPVQIAELNNEIQSCSKEAPLFISVDHEGGKVQRFKKGFTLIPEAASIAALKSPKLAFEISEVIAKELKAVGINLNYYPVADIATNPKNPVIGNRAYGDNPETVSKFVSAVIRGHLLHDVQVVAKHFPGHGDTALDSHFALPRVDTPLEVLRSREWMPFQKAIRSKCGLIMTAHILHSTIDPDRPATFSKRFLQDYLRKELHYDQLIISDDLEMKAITDHYGAEDAPRLALEAGCDLLIYRSEEAARHGYTALVRALEERKLSEEIVFAAARRVQYFKKTRLKKHTPIAIPSVSRQLATEAHLALVERASGKSFARSKS
jgi:beta-N-acetylhexosaminidase